MNEEKKTERFNEKETSGDTGTGDKSSASSIVEQADLAAERLAKENERFEANIRRQEEIMAKQTLGGRSEISKPEPVKQLTDNEFYKKFLKGGTENPFK